MKKIMVISSSPHKISNSEMLANYFIKGAKEAGHTCEMIKIRDLDMKFCKGCLACQKKGNCVIKDGITKNLLNSIMESDILVFATPVYYYAISGQLKTFIDRMNPLYPTNYKFRDIYVIATAAEDEARTFRGIKEDIKGFVDCYANAKLRGTVFIGGLDNGGDVKTDKDALDKAYQMGKKIK